MNIRNLFRKARERLNRVASTSVTNMVHALEELQLRPNASVAESAAKEIGSRASRCHADCRALEQDVRRLQEAYTRHAAKPSASRSSSDKLRQTQLRRVSAETFRSYLDAINDASARRAAYVEWSAAQDAVGLRLTRQLPFVNIDIDRLEQARAQQQLQVAKDYAGASRRLILAIDCVAQLTLDALPPSHAVSARATMVVQRIDGMLKEFPEIVIPRSAYLNLVMLQP